MRWSFLIAALTSIGDTQDAQQRTVTASEIGSVFTHPNGFQYSDFGAALFTSTSGILERLSPDAIKVMAARFHIFKPSDDRVWSYFPFTDLQRYDADERAAGRAPLFVTATYRGKNDQSYGGGRLT